MIVVCVMTKLPIVLVGKPGTSKTLSMIITRENLRHHRRHRSFLVFFRGLHLYLNEWLWCGVWVHILLLCLGINDFRTPIGDDCHRRRRRAEVDADHKPWRKRVCSAARRRAAPKRWRQREPANHRRQPHSRFATLTSFNPFEVTAIKAV